MIAPARAAVVPALVVALLGSATSTRHLHESDSGRTLHVHRGDTITVRLPGGSMGGYHRPRTSDRHAVSRTSASGGYPTDTDARATFVARHRGHADLTSTNDYRCLHKTPRCLPPQKQWVVHVVVG